MNHFSGLRDIKRRAFKQFIDRQPKIRRRCRHLINKKHTAVPPGPRERTVSKAHAFVLINNIAADEIRTVQAGARSDRNHRCVHSGAVLIHKTGFAGTVRAADKQRLTRTDFNPGAHDRQSVLFKNIGRIQARNQAPEFRFNILQSVS